MNTKLRDSFVTNQVSNGRAAHLTLDFSALLKGTDHHCFGKVLKKKTLLRALGLIIAAAGRAGGLCKDLHCLRGRNDDSGFESQVTANRQDA